MMSPGFSIEVSAGISESPYWYLTFRSLGRGDLRFPLSNLGQYVSLDHDKRESRIAEFDNTFYLAGLPPSDQHQACRSLLRRTTVAGWALPEGLPWTRSPERCLDQLARIPFMLDLYPRGAGSSVLGDRHIGDDDLQRVTVYMPPPTWTTDSVLDHFSEARERFGGTDQAVLCAHLQPSTFDSPPKPWAYQALSDEYHAQLTSAVHRLFTNLRMFVRPGARIRFVVDEVDRAAESKLADVLRGAALDSSGLTVPPGFGELLASVRRGESLDGLDPDVWVAADLMGAISLGNPAAHQPAERKPRPIEQGPASRPLRVGPHAVPSRHLPHQPYRLN